jgi:hypothetical protein
MFYIKDMIIKKGGIVFDLFRLTALFVLPAKNQIVFSWFPVSITPIHYHFLFGV